jgi:hypothetical protein
MAWVGWVAFLLGGLLHEPVEPWAALQTGASSLPVVLLMA